MRHAKIVPVLLVFINFVLGACSSLDGKRNESLRQVQDEQIALNNQVNSGLVQPGTPAYFNEVRRVRQRWVETYLPVVDSGFEQHNTLLATMNDPAASAKTRASASTELVDLRQKLYGMLVEVTTFNQQVQIDQASAQQAGYPWHLDYPKLLNTPPQVFTATAVQQIPGFELASAPAQPQPVQYIPLAPNAPQGAQGQQGGQPAATSIPLGNSPTPAASAPVAVPVAPPVGASGQPNGQ